MCWLRSGQLHADRVDTQLAAPAAGMAVHGAAKHCCMYGGACGAAEHFCREKYEPQQWHELVPIALDDAP
jgi:hypothetical protein